MMRKGLVSVACLSLLAACSGSSGSKATSSTSSRTASPTPTASQVPSKVTLQPALLTVSDFPTGWTTKPVDDSEGDLSGSCADKLDAFDKKYADSTDKVEADFEKDASEVDETIQGYASSAELAREFAEYAGLVRECRTLTVKIEGTKLVLNVGELSLPKFGDESIGFSAKGNYKGIEFQINEVTVRRGGLLVSFTQSDVLGTDADFLVTVINKAMTRVNEVLPPRP